MVDIDVEVIERRVGWCRARIPSTPTWLATWRAVMSTTTIGDRAGGAAGRPRLAVGLAGCGKAGARRTPCPEPACRWRRGARIVAHVRSCDRGANAYCAVQLVVVGPGYRSSAALLAGEAAHLRALGWTDDGGRHRPRSARRTRPGNGLRLSLATASERPAELGSRLAQAPSGDRAALCADDVRARPRALAHAADGIFVKRAAGAPAPTDSALRPAEQVTQVVADQLGAPAAQRAHLGLGLAAPVGADDLLELARGRRSARRPGRPPSTRARSSASASAISGASPASERARPSSRAIGGASRPTAIASRIACAAALDRRRMQAADLLQPGDRRRLALGQLHQRRVGQDRADGTVQIGRRALAPGGQLARHRARARVQLPDPRQSLPGGLGVALVGGRLQPAALLARPLQPPGAPPAAAGSRRTAAADGPRPRPRSRAARRSADARPSACSWPSCRRAGRGSGRAGCRSRPGRWRRRSRRRSGCRRCC